MAIKVTDNAFNKVQQLITSENNPDLVLKIWLEGGGCSGLQYKFQLVSSQEIAEGDSVFVNGMARIIIDKDLTERMANGIVDFRDELIGYGFKFENPDAKSKCGCGNSFAA